MVKPITTLILLTTIVALGWQATPTGAQPACRFVSGFATLRELVGPDTVGACLEDEHVNADDGNVEQRTTGGLLVWRAVDNVTTFSDDVTNWVNGPNGLQSRPSGERLSWESDPEGPSQPTPSSAEASTASSPPSSAPSLFVLAPPQATSMGAGRASDPVPPSPTGVPIPTATASPGSSATPTRAATPVTPSTPTSSSATGRTDPVGGQCPPSHRIKGATSSTGQKLSYEPERPEYAKVTPDVCFTAGGDARDAGYVSSKR